MGALVASGNALRGLARHAMAKAAPGYRDRQHRAHLRDDARADRACERLPGRGPSKPSTPSGVDAFVVKAGAAGPFLGSTPSPDVDLARVSAVSPASTAAAPLGCVGTIMRDGASTRNVTAFGAPAHGPGMPQVSEGRAPATPDEVAASSTLGRHIGDSLQVGARTCGSSASCPIHRTGENAQHLPHDRGPAAGGLQRTADGHFDRHQRHIPERSRTATRPRPSGRRQRPDAPVEGRGRVRSRSWPSCCGSWRC